MSVRSDHSYHSFPPRVPRQPRMQESLASEWNRVKLGTSKAEFGLAWKLQDFAFAFAVPYGIQTIQYLVARHVGEYYESTVYRLPELFTQRRFAWRPEKIYWDWRNQSWHVSTLSFAVNFPRAVCLPFSADLVLPGWCSSSSYAPTDFTVTTWEQNGTKRIKETCLKYFKVRIQFTAYLTGSDECGWYDVFE